MIGYRMAETTTHVVLTKKGHHIKVKYIYCGNGTSHQWIAKDEPSEKMHATWKETPP